jgi:type I restriction enzyme S subunit
LGFREVPLGELVTLRRGYDLPAVERRPGSVPVVSSSGVVDHHAEARERGPGVILGRTGTLGRITYVDEDYWPLNTTFFVADFKGHEPRFVSGLLETLDYAALNDKAAIPGVCRHTLHDLRVPALPPREQRRIGKLLELLDRKREVLRALDRTLARLGYALFRELPRRREAALGDLCETIVNGGTPARRDAECWRDGTIPWYRSGELDDGPLIAAAESITPAALQRSNCRLLEPGTVLVALYASPTVGRLGVLTEPATANQACCALVPRPGQSGALLFHLLFEARNRLQSLASGAAQQNIRQSVVVDLRVRLPDDARGFGERVDLLWRQRASCRRELAALDRLRRAELARWLT